MQIKDTLPENNSEYPNSIVVSKILPDGKTKVEYIYELGEGRGGLPEYKQKNNKQSILSPLLYQLKTFKKMMQIKKRIFIILTKFIALLFVFLGSFHFFPATRNLSLFETIVFILGAACFAVIPFSVLVHTINTLRAEKKPQRYKEY